MREAKMTGFAITMTFLSMVAPCASSAAEVAVIVHPSVKEDSLDKKLLLDVYKGEVRAWKDGTKIKVWDLGERGETRKSFYDYLGVKSSRMNSWWSKQLFTGEGEPPDKAETQEEMVMKVTSTPGSIGYVDKELVDKADKGIKLLILIEKREPKKSD